MASLSQAVDASAPIAAGAAFAWGALLLLLFGLDHRAVIIPAGTSAERVPRRLNRQAGSRRAVSPRHACGVLIIVAGA